MTEPSPQIQGDRESDQTSYRHRIHQPSLRAFARRRRRWVIFQRGRVVADRSDEGFHELFLFGRGTKSTRRPPRLFRRYYRNQNINKRLPRRVQLNQAVNERARIWARRYRLPAGPMAARAWGTRLPACDPADHGAAVAVRRDIPREPVMGGFRSRLSWIAKSALVCSNCFRIQTSEPGAKKS